MRIPIYLLSLLISPIALASEPPVAKISVMASGEILLNGVEHTAEQIDAELEQVSGENGTVWYYRESALGNPPAEAMEVIRIVVKHQLPISMSTKSDFSDYVDEHGVSRPRKP